MYVFKSNYDNHHFVESQQQALQAFAEKNVSNRNSFQIIYFKQVYIYYDSKLHEFYISFINNNSFIQLDFMKK